MAIRYRDAPKEGLEILQTALRASAARGPVPDVLRGDWTVGDPLPVYRVDSIGIRSPSPLARAKFAGWRYPVATETSRASAFLQSDRGRLRYVGLTEGDFPGRLMAALVHANEVLATGDQDYEARLLEVYALPFFALWLYEPRRGTLVETPSVPAVPVFRPGSRGNAHRHLRRIVEEARL